MFLNGKIKHNDTFSKRKLSEIPKFVQKKMSNKIEEEEVKKELSSWVIKQEIVPSKVEPLSTFIEATSKK